MHKNPKVIVITINYNQSDMTVQCTRSIMAMLYGNFSLCLIDNGSKYSEYKKLKNEIGNNVSILRIEKNIGYTKAINYALEKTVSENPDYWLIMNNDTIIDKYAIRYLVDTAEKYNRNAIVSGKVYHFYEPNRIQYIGGRFIDGNMLKNVNLFKDEIDIGQAEEEMEMDMLDDIFWLLPKKIYQMIGGYYPVYFMYAEQADYAMNVKKNGFKLIYTPKARIWHKGELSSEQEKVNPVTRYWRSKNSMIFLYRYLPAHQFIYRFFIAGPRLLVMLIFWYFSDKTFKDRLASLLGYFAFIKWWFKRDIDWGYNPFIRR